MTSGVPTKPLAELCEFRNGLWKGKKPPYVHVGIIRNTNFNADGTLDETNIAFHDVEAKQLKSRQLEFGDIILEKSGGGPKQPVGRVITFEKQNGTYSFSNFTSVIRVCDPDKLDFRYLHRVLFWYYAFGITEGMQRRSTGIRNLDFIAYKQLEIPVPPLPEQQRIVRVLDEAFDGIATAKANAEKNLQNARALFESHLTSTFTQRGNRSQVSEKAGRDAQAPIRSGTKQVKAADPNEATERTTKTGGRDATTRRIPPRLALAVGMPKTPVSGDWRWSALTDLARMESGHTPSRRHPEYWNGTIPWIGIKDARANHGRRITDTEQKTNELGLANSSARLLPANTVCLSRTASVGYVLIMGRPMSTSQDFVNWVCSDRLNPEFLMYLFLAEGREGLLRYSSGAIHQTIYYPEAKAFHIAHPDTGSQERIVEHCHEMREDTGRLESIYQRKLSALDELKHSLLHQAFSGQL